MLDLAPRWSRAPALVRAEILAGAWEVFSVLLFISAVLPRAFSSTWPAVLFASSLALSAASIKRVEKAGDIGLTITFAFRCVAWLAAVTPLLDGLEIRVLIATSGFGVMAGGIRRAVYRLYFDEPSDAPPRRSLWLTLRSRLSEGAMVAGIVGGHVMLLFSVAFLRTSSQTVFRAWWEIIPVLAILATTSFSFAIGPISEPVVNALVSEADLDTGTVRKALNRAIAIPRRLARLNFLLWIACTTTGVLYFQMADGAVSWAAAFMQIAFGALFAGGVTFYQRSWHEDIIQPAVAELRQRAGTQAAPDDESIRRRMLRDFGTPVLFVLALSLLAAISLYRSLGVGLDWREDFNAITALCASFLMLVIAVGGVFLRAARRLAGPLSRLAEASDRVASGNLDAAMPNVEGPREVVALAERIEDMRQTLAETIDALEQERSGLESRVIARTTELEEAIDELKRTQAALVHGERMASIGELMAGVAHEVFNPLNAISGSVSALERLSEELEAMLAAYRERESHLPPEDREALEAERERLDIDGALQDLAGVARVVTSATKRCVRIVGNLKRFARAAEDPVATDLHASLNETVALLAHRIKQHDIEVSTDYGQLPEILCRDGEIGQVFMNLLSNAIFAAASAQGSHDGRIHLCTRRDDDLVVIEVQDNGSGVPEELQDKVFEPFFTTKSRMDGTGLGLSISQDIVRRHGGQLALVSPGFLEGARFRCELPVAGPKARPSHKGIVGAPSRKSS